MIITLDGPTASGKSTVACLLAQKLNCPYINSGLLYRFLGFCALKQSFALEQLATVPAEFIQACISTEQFDYCFKNGCPRIIYNVCDITDQLKTACIDQAASCIALNNAARVCVTKYQHAFAQHSALLIADGRDCGTQVFPHAAYKFFITAALEIRAQRWRAEQAKRQIFISLHESIACIQERDTRDITRAQAPLILASDAYVIDTSTYTPEHVVEIILSTIAY